MMNKIYKNIIRYGLIFIAVFTISCVTPQYYQDVFGFGFILVLAFCIGFILSQSIKDIEEYLDKKDKKPCNDRWGVLVKHMVNRGKICNFKNCDSHAIAKGYCSKHLPYYYGKIKNVGKIDKTETKDVLLVSSLGLTILIFLTYLVYFCFGGWLKYMDIQKWYNKWYLVVWLIFLVVVFIVLCLFFCIEYNCSQDVIELAIVLVVIVFVILLILSDILFFSKSDFLLDDYEDAEEFKRYTNEERITRRSAMRILRERFVNDEITKEEYTEKMARL